MGIENLVGCLGELVGFLDLRPTVYRRVPAKKGVPGPFRGCQWTVLCIVNYILACHRRGCPLIRIEG
ncbi:hypothetical protein SDC9_85729 [bioreactor metagenome]|uniref:Uncharacterized protein n=1 Tax=bioreactor metagenome TaxID=1076179 RepID=A0A644ZEH9_9ZZZZ